MRFVKKRVKISLFCLTICFALFTRCQSSEFVFNQTNANIFGCSFKNVYWTKYYKVDSLPKEIFEYLKINNIFLTDNYSEYNATSTIAVNTEMPNSFFSEGGKNDSTKSGYILYSLGGFVERNHIFLYKQMVPNHFNCIIMEAPYGMSADSIMSKISCL